MAEGHYAAIVEGSVDAIISKDAEGTITSWNPGAERLYGYDAAEAIGRPISILIPRHRSGEEVRVLRRALAGDRVERHETERLTKDGRLINVSLTVSPIRRGDGTITGASVIARDITDRVHARERAEQLQAVTRALSLELSPERAAQVLLDSALPTLGAVAGTVGLLGPDGQTVRTVGSRGHRKDEAVRSGALPLDADMPIRVAIASGESLWAEGAAEVVERFPPLSESELRLGALAVIPLAVEGNTFGAMALGFDRERAFNPEDRAFLLAAAHQAANAMERARLYATERATGDRLAFLAEASELLAMSLDPQQVLERLAFLAVPRIADWCAISLAGDGEPRTVVAHADPAKGPLAQELQQRYPVDPDAPRGEGGVIRSGKPELHPSVSEELLRELARDHEHLRLLREAGAESMLIVPLSARGRTLGALSLVASQASRRLDESDLHFAQELARRAALAIDTSLAYRREREAALTLQRALLPERLPRVEGLRSAARYLPAGTDLEAGGDWFDLVESPDGGVIAMVGDVAGSGVRAASVMGQLRTALRAYAIDGRSGAATVERLNRLMDDFDSTEMATLFHARLDLASSRLHYVRAGHLPALLRRPDGTVECLDGEPAPPIGVLAAIDAREYEAALEPGSVLLMYTDGLIERRDRGIDQGIARLAGLLSSLPGDPEPMLDSIVEMLDAERSDDDVALLAVGIGELRG